MLRNTQQAIEFPDTRKLFDSKALICRPLFKIEDYGLSTFSFWRFGGQLKASTTSVVFIAWLLVRCSVIDMLDFPASRVRYNMYQLAARVC